MLIVCPQGLGRDTERTMGLDGHLLIMDIEILLSRHTEDSVYALVLQSGYE
jgi:hypothetical protein